MVRGIDHVDEEVFKLLGVEELGEHLHYRKASLQQRLFVGVREKDRVLLLLSTVDLLESS